MQVAPLVASSNVAAFKDPYLTALDDLILRMARLALSCTAMPTASRPTMSQVLVELVKMRGEVVEEQGSRATSRIDKEIDSSTEVDFDAQMVRLELVGSQTETSALAVGATRGTPHTPFFEGCSPSPLAPSYDFSAAVDILGAEDVGAGSAINGKRHSSKGKGGRGGGGGSGGGGGGGSGGSGGGGGGGSGWSCGGSEGSGGSGGGGGGGGSSGGTGSGGNQGGAVQRGGSGGGQHHQQQRRSETPSPQQLREWFAQCGASGTCGKLHSQHRCYSRLDDARCAKFGDEAERPRWAELLRSGVDIFALDYDAILAAMYALSVSAEGVCYPCVPANPGIEAAALRASESDLPGTVPAEALHTFTLDSGASHRFFCDSTTLTPLPAHVPLRLADPSGGAVLARSSTILPCPAVPSGSLSGLHLPSFSTNLVSTAALQVAMVTTTTLGGQRVLICTCTRMGRHLATFTRRPRSSLYTLTTEPPQVATSTQVSASGLCLPSRPRLTLPCLPCVKGRQRAAPHSSFPPATAPLQTLQMDVWGPARISGQDRENYFLVVVEDYMRYTTVFLLRSKGEVPDVLILWIRTVRLQLRERFHEDLPVLRLHSDRGGEFSSDLLQDFSQPLAPCLFAGDLAYTALDEEGWRCVGVLGLGLLVLLPQGPTPSGVSQVDPLPLAEPVEVTKDSGAARGAASGGSEPASAEPGGAEPASADPEGAKPEGADPGGADSEGAESGGAEPGGAEPQGAEPWGAESEGAES
ncbi:unnamed protein product [Closterium sp. NIES-54]